MNETTFWEIVSRACRSDPRGADEWDQRLQAELEKYDPDEIIEWNHVFDRLAARAYTIDLWCAAYLINGGGSAAKIASTVARTSAIESSTS